MTQLSIIIITHNSAACLEGFLKGLDSDVKKRIIVVDNGSTDGTKKLVKNKGFACLDLGRNLGYARAANIGANHADTEYLCFINPDCRPSQGFFKEGVTALDIDPHTCVVPIFIEPGYREISGHQPGYTRLKLITDILETNYPAQFLARWLKRRAGFHDSDWSWAHGACFFISRQVFLDLGGFDEDYFLYMEDVDLGRRFTEKGGRIAPFQEKIFHAVGQSSCSDTTTRRAWLDRSRIQYARNHYGNWFGFFLYLLTLPAGCYRKLGMRRT